ncbi:PQQ-dependent sugar dehydrogenase [Vibrio ponticus]|uniref:PQQ-dependent sugar dehydrogenase n=1 Tax=Vibrio ponticus TaxID=265668 RepID=A0A3N3E1T4_9VIBR|nr:PQQ-dependent sugar dehydrogenase [Vibrio ponticus]ROV60697.1 PQQ-dependent sugar dehydrogenase [Vibrio ponticus]
MKWTLSLAVLVASYTSYASEWRPHLITDGLNVPWGMSEIDQKRILVTERNGRVGILNWHSGHYLPIRNFPNVAATGQGGLLDVARSPFNSGDYYFTYSRDVSSGIETVLAKGQLVEDKLINLEDIFVSYSGSRSGRHYGSRITFDDSHIYMSIGDRGERGNGQNLQTHAGSIVRLMPDGSIPSSNPFLSSGKAASAIWSYGHRNPQGLFYDNVGKNLWSVEHGPRGGDEINLIQKGENYGWPITSHGKEYWGPISVGEAQEKDGIQSPHKVYIPSIAPSSMVLYRGEQYAELNGKLLIGALKLTHLNVVSLNDQNVMVEQRILEDLGERIRAVIVTSDDNILFSTDSGKIFQLLPNGNQL